MNLFLTQNFTMHSGGESDWKIECDALTGADWRTLARLIAQRIGPFRSAYGVPWGGMQLAEELAQFATGSESDPWLLVDDVYSTGASMRHLRSGFGENAKVIGVVVFARQPVRENWIKAVFTMTLDDNGTHHE